MTNDDRSTEAERPSTCHATRHPPPAIHLRSVVEMRRLSRERDTVPADHSHAPFFLLGPTAVGKSRIAVEFAERVGGEIVGADAFQVYAGLDLLSAKPPPELRARVPHHLVGEVPLTASFDV